MCSSSNTFNLLKNHTNLTACNLHVFNMLQETYTQEIVDYSCHTHGQETSYHSCHTIGQKGFSPSTAAFEAQLGCPSFATLLFLWDSFQVVYICFDTTNKAHTYPLFFKRACPSLREPTPETGSSAFSRKFRYYTTRVTPSCRDYNTRS